jgi:hypothetical protein
LARGFLVSAAAVKRSPSLWFFPMTVAHALVPKTAYGNTIHLRTREAAQVGCGLLGLWLLAQTAPWLVSILVRAILFAGDEHYLGILSARTKLELAVSGAQVVLALLLVFRSGAAARIIVPPVPEAAAVRVPD